MNSITLIGMVAAALTTLSFIPQVWVTIRTRRTQDISLSMYIIFNLGVALWLIYGIMIQDLPVICANGVTLSLTLTVLVLKLKHG